MPAIARRRTRKRITATTLDEAELRRIINSLSAPNPRDRNGNEGPSGGGRFRRLHRLVRQRDEHFFALPAADQKLPHPYEDVEPFQSDILRQSWVDLKSRLVENPFRIRVEPPTEKTRDKNAANKLEIVLQTGLGLVEEREDIDILGGLADGIILHGPAVLHWQKAADVWPDFPDPEEVDELPEGEEKRYRDRSEDDDYAEGEKRYRETADSQKERDDHAKARAGFPFFVEVLRADQCAWVRDRSMANGFALFLVVRETPLLTYREELQKQDRIVLSLNDADKRLLVYEERDAPSRDDPSRELADRAWDGAVQVCHLWSRTEFYELAKRDGDADWVVVKSHTHPYEMPPFALAAGDEVNHPDPSMAFLPLLEGLYRLKPFHDHDVTLGRHIAEQIALPFYWIKQANGEPVLDGEGRKLVLSRNAAAAQRLPEGATLEKVEFELNPAFMAFLQLTGEQLDEAKPESGIVEVGASTAPFTLKLAQEQANAGVKKSKKSLARAVRTMARNMALVMQKSADEGGFGRPVPVYAKTKDGKVDRSTAIMVDPEDIPTLEIEVDIDPLSAAQQVTNIQFQRELLNDPMVPYGRQQFVEDALQEEDPEGYIAAYDAETIFETRIKPGLIEQELAKKFGGVFVVTPELGFAGVGGDAATPEQVLSANGMQVQQPPQVGAAPVGVGGGPVMAGGPGIGGPAPTAPLQVPGAYPEPGLV